MSQRWKSGQVVDSRAQWTNLALLGEWFTGGARVWSPEYPEKVLVLQCRGCRKSLGRVVYHDGTAHGAPQPVYLAQVQTVVTNPSARPVETARSTVVLSPLTLDVLMMRRLVTEPNRRHLLDEATHQHLLEWLDSMVRQYPSGKIPVTADPREEIRLACGVVAHRPAGITAGALLAAARNGRRVLWL